MWRTSQGDRVLTGGEAELFREVVGYLLDRITEAMEYNDPYQCGVLLFDRLQPTGQLATLYLVARALLDPQQPQPELTAIHEATVYAVYRELIVLIEIEIDTEDLPIDSDNISDTTESRFEVRAQTLAAYEQDLSADELEDLKEDGFVPGLECGDVNQWESIVESLADRILWDRDFEMEYLMADQNPEKSRLLKRHLGITDDYYTSIAPDSTGERIGRLKDEIRKLIQ